MGPTSSPTETPLTFFSLRELRRHRHEGARGGSEHTLQQSDSSTPCGGRRVLVNRPAHYHTGASIFKCVHITFRNRYALLTSLPSWRRRDWQVRDRRLTWMWGLHQDHWKISPPLVEVPQALSHVPPVWWTHRITLLNFKLNIKCRTSHERVMYATVRILSAKLHKIERYAYSAICFS